MNYVIILAAGQGQRMRTNRDKMLISAAGKPIIYYSLMAYNDHPEIAEIVVVANKDNKEEIERIVKKYHFPKIKKVIIGGVLRQRSLEKGIEFFDKKATPDDLIVAHNGANPLPSEEEISASIKLAKKEGACIVGHFSHATIKEVEKKFIKKTHDRAKIFLAETPQVAKFGVLEKALKKAKGREYTDEAMLLETVGQKVTYIEAGENNFKITTQADLLKLKTILGETPEDFRVGIGQDSHMFDKKKKGLMIGGILIKNLPKLQANSDGDVILHAVFNALSQAIGDKSIGFYADEICKKGITDSREYLKAVMEKIKTQKFNINSLGVMVECKFPKIDLMNGKLKKSLAEILKINTARIGITATSGEEMTVFGNGLGMQCFAIISLVKTKE